MRKMRLEQGDFVEVLEPVEIMKTLDSDGKLDNLPFMPEMIQFCGRTFKVKARIENTCALNFDNDDLASEEIKEFKYNDVVSLEELRCDGSSHGDCQAGCTLFWKVAWLKKTDGKTKEISKELKSENELKKKLKTKLDEHRYLCQSTNLSSATIEITRTNKLLKLVHKTYKGEISLFDALKTIFNVIMRKLKIIKPVDETIKGNLKRTPTKTLNLQPGEIVEVKSFDEILKTLDEQGKNKGLGFHQGLVEYCGKQLKVRNRLDRIINEVTGEMIKINNTVFLEDSVCKKCPRERYHYWREIWLKRIKNQNISVNKLKSLIFIFTLFYTLFLFHSDDFLEFSACCL